MTTDDPAIAENSAEAASGVSASTPSPLQQGSGWVLVSAGTGFIVGLVWLILAPRVGITITDGGVEQSRNAATAPFDADLMLGGLLLVAGVVLSIIWLVRGSTRAGLWGLVLGGLLAGMLAAWVGTTFSGPAVDIDTLPAGTTAELGIRLRSWPMLLWWPAATLVLAALFGRFSSPTSEPEATPLPVASPSPE
jgi:hypothetical protein